MRVFGSANCSLPAEVWVFRRGMCEFGVRKGGKKIERSGSFLLHHAVMCCDECLRLCIQLRHRLITTEDKAANQKDLDHNKPSLLICDVKHR